MIMTINGNVVLCGRVAKEPEKKVIEKGDKTFKLINLSVVVAGSGENSKWANVYSWGELLKNVKKGDTILVCGTLETDEYDARDGSRKKSEKINAEFLQIMQKNSNSQSSNAITNENVQQLDEGITEIDDDSLPF